jgi:hypothetical protein
MGTSASSSDSEKKLSSPAYSRLKLLHADLTLGAKVDPTLTTVDRASRGVQTSDHGP